MLSSSLLFQVGKAVFIKNNFFFFFFFFFFLGGYFVSFSVFFFFFFFLACLSKHAAFSPNMLELISDVFMTQKVYNFRRGDFRQFVKIHK